MASQASRTRRSSDRKVRKSRVENDSGTDGAGSSASKPLHLAQGPWTEEKEITKTRTRLEGKRGQFRWSIYVDAPGGHGGANFDIIRGVELLEVDGDMLSSSKRKPLPKGKSSKSVDQCIKRREQPEAPDTQAILLSIPERYLKTPDTLDFPATPSHQTPKLDFNKARISTTSQSLDETLVDSAMLPETSIDGSKLHQVLLESLDPDSPRSTDADGKYDQKYIMEPARSSHRSTMRESQKKQKNAPVHDSFADYMHHSFSADSACSESDGEDFVKPEVEQSFKVNDAASKPKPKQPVHIDSATTSEQVEMSFTVETLLGLSKVLDTTPLHDQRRESHKKQPLKQTGPKSDNLPNEPLSAKGDHRQRNVRRSSKKTVPENSPNDATEVQIKRKPQSSRRRTTSNSERLDNQPQLNQSEEGTTQKRKRSRRKTSSGIDRKDASSKNDMASNTKSGMKEPPARLAKPKQPGCHSCNSESSSETSSVWLNRNHQSFVAKHTLKNPYEVPELIMDRTVTNQFMQLNLEDGGDVQEVENCEVESLIASSKEEQTDESEQTSGRDSVPRKPRRQLSSDLNDMPSTSESEESRISESLDKRKGIGKLLRSKSALAASSSGNAFSKKKRSKSMDRSTRFKQFLAFANASFNSASSGGELLDDDEDESLF